MAILKMVHSHILEGDLLLLLKRETTGVPGPLEDSKFGGYKNYNPLAARQATYGSGNSSTSDSASTSTSSLPQLPAVHGAESTTIEIEPMTVSVGEQLIDNYQVTELPDDGCSTATCSSQQHLVETALLARIEFLEAQLEKLKSTDNGR